MYNDENFDKILKMLLGIEGGYVNDPDDRGGATNYGITQTTMNAWRKMNNLPLGSVKTDLTQKEVKDIYYNMYWKESGADKCKNLKDAMILFDTAVNSGPQQAKRIFKESNENFDEMLKNRKQYYDDILSRDPSQEKFREGWYNRLKTLEKNAKIIDNNNFNSMSSTKESNSINNDNFLNFPQTKEEKFDQIINKTPNMFKNIINEMNPVPQTLQNNTIVQPPLSDEEWRRRLRLKRMGLL